MNIRTISCILLLHALLSARSSWSAPPAEQLLPADTLALVSTPGLTHLEALWNRTCQGTLWQDPGFKPFRDKFIANLETEIFQPLEREWGVDLQELPKVVGGPITLAAVRATSPDRGMEYVFLADCQEKRTELATNFHAFRQAQIKAGKPLRTEKIRGVEFVVVSTSSNTVPKTVSRFFPRLLDLREIGGPAKPGAGRPSEIYIGQARSLLIIAACPKILERMLISYEDGGIPVVGDLASYGSCQNSLFRKASLYGWLNAPKLMDLLNLSAGTDKAGAEGGMDVIRPEILMRASGLGSLTSVAFAMDHSVEGIGLKIVFTVPESNRRGVFKALSALPADTAVPEFVPADVVRFRRWRLDGQKTWAVLEQMLGEFSPQSASALDFILSTANDAARLKDPSFDIKRNLFGNLGDDFIYLEKPPRSTTPAQISSAPSLLLVKSPDPLQLAASLKSILVLMSAQAETPAEREFLGRKIYSVPLPYLPNPLGDNSALTEARVLHYAAGATYVALSTEPALVEEYLRSPETRADALRQLPRLNEAAQKVADPGTILFGFHNQLARTRVEYEAMRGGGTLTNQSFSSSLLTDVFGLASPEQSLCGLMDCSLLPPFDRVANHFGFSVHAASVTADGITWKFFSPAKPPMQAAQR